MLGLARSGEAAALVLARRGVVVVGVDREPGIDAGRLQAAGVEVRLGADADVSLLEGVEVLVKSPGVRREAPLVEAARHLGVPVWSEIELGARLVAQPTVGVTGTNGKTTTSELLGAIFRAAGRPAAVCGNVGRPLCALDGTLTADEAVVCELSSFQLEDVETLRCRVAVLLNVTLDHLDRHGDLASYRAAKLRIFENQGPDDVAVVPRGFDSGPGGLPGRGRRVEFAADDPLPAEPLIRGEHNRENSRRGRRCGACRRHFRGRRSPRRCGRSPASLTGSSPSVRSTACSSSTTRRRRTPSRPSGRFAPTTRAASG